MPGPCVCFALPVVAAIGLVSIAYAIYSSQSTSSQHESSGGSSYTPPPPPPPEQPRKNGGKGRKNDSDDDNGDDDDDGDDDGGYDKTGVYKTSSTTLPRRRRPIGCDDTSNVIKETAPASFAPPYNSPTPILSYNAYQYPPVMPNFSGLRSDLNVRQPAIPQANNRQVPTQPYPAYPLTTSTPYPVNPAYPITPPIKGTTYQPYAQHYPPYPAYPPPPTHINPPPTHINPPLTTHLNSTTPLTNGTTYQPSTQLANPTNTPTLSNIQTIPNVSLNANTPQPNTAVKGLLYPSINDLQTPNPPQENPQLGNFTNNTPPALPYSSPNKLHHPYRPSPNFDSNNNPTPSQCYPSNRNSSRRGSSGSSIISDTSKSSGHSSRSSCSGCSRSSGSSRCSRCCSCSSYSRSSSSSRCSDRSGSSGISRYSSSSASSSSSVSLGLVNESESGSSESSLAYSISRWSATSVVEEMRIASPALSEEPETYMGSEDETVVSLSDFFGETESDACSEGKQGTSPSSESSSSKRHRHHHHHHNDHHHHRHGHHHHHSSSSSTSSCSSRHGSKKESETSSRRRLEKSPGDDASRTSGSRHHGNKSNGCAQSSGIGSRSDNNRVVDDYSTTLTRHHGGKHASGSRRHSNVSKDDTHTSGSRRHDNVSKDDTHTSGSRRSNRKSDRGKSMCNEDDAVTSGIRSHRLRIPNKRCFICFRGSSDVAFVTLEPCGHSGVCKECIEALLDSSIFKCPLCGKTIESYKRLIG